MVIGGLFHGEPGAGLIGQMQRSEYTCYFSQLNRRRGKVFVLTGTASMFRSRAWPVRLLAVTVLPALVFNMFLNLVDIKGISDMSRG